MLRYITTETDDGLAGKEGTFLICSFWLVSALCVVGEMQRASDLLEKLLRIASPLGLYAEEFEVGRARHLGQLPPGVLAPRAHRGGRADHPDRAPRGAVAYDRARMTSVAACWVEASAGSRLRAASWAARACRVTLVDRHDYTQFQPLLYQVATSQLPAEDIARPLKDGLRRPARSRSCRRTWRLPTSCRTDLVLSDGRSLTAAPGRRCRGAAELLRYPRGGRARVPAVCGRGRRATATAPQEMLAGRRR